MKKVHTPAMVAHLWANQSQDEARTATGNFYFTGPLLFSYGRHHVVAAHTPAGIVRNADTASVTTGRHHRYMWQALKYQRDLMEVSGLRGEHFSGPAYMVGLASLAIEQAENAAESLAKKRPGFGPHNAALALRDARLATARRLLETAQADKAAAKAARDLAKTLPGDDLELWARQIGKRRASAKMDELIARIRPAMEDARHAKDYGGLAYAVQQFKVVFDLLARATDAAKIAGRKVSPALVRECGALRPAQAQAEIEYQAELRAAYLREVSNAKRSFYIAKRAKNARRMGSALYVRLPAFAGTPTDAEFERMKAQAAQATVWELAADNLKTVWDSLAVVEAAKFEGAETEQLKTAGAVLNASARANSCFRLLPTEHRQRAAVKARADALAPIIALAHEIQRDAARIQLQGWRDGGALPYSAHSLPVMLRIKGDELQTSKGASVPLGHAVRVFRFVKLCREKGEGWKRNGRTLRVGHFQVDEVMPDGSFIAGCHEIGWTEIEAAAIAAGVLNCEAEDTREGASHE